MRRWRELLGVWLMLGMVPAAALAVGLECVVGWSDDGSTPKAAYRLYRDGQLVREIASTETDGIERDRQDGQTYYLANCDHFGLEITGIEADANDQELEAEEPTEENGEAHESPALAPRPERRLSSVVNLLAHSQNFSRAHSPTHLFDGCISDSALCTSGNQGIASFWVLLDLGHPRRLSRARLFGDAGGAWQTVRWSLRGACAADEPWMEHAYMTLSPVHGWMEMPLSGVTARYVRVEVFGVHGGTQARELEIYGAPEDVECEP